MTVPPLFTETVELPAAPPFDLAAALGFMCGFAPTAGEQSTDGGTLTRALRAAGRTVAAQVVQAGDGVRATLHAAEPLTGDVVGAAADRIAFQLSLDDDLTGFYAIGRKDLAFAPVLDRLHGYHQVKFPTPLENLVWAILSQRAPQAAATRGKHALRDEFGDRITVDGAEYAAFPDIDQLVTLPEERIAELVGNQRKGRYLHGALHAWHGTDEEFLRTGPYGEVKEFLLSLPGIGAWSANFILIRGLGRMDETPLEKALRGAASRAYGRSLSDDELQRIAAGYGPWQGYWAHYLRAAS
ncbi:DNA-3-methyladenine glycosylase family protein [Actinomadura violacea]|uniref:DNA-3-methyladenine glycosylase II n=1 Tax=Actinomadura violacea TaxID=2819934 RepID=A0ABS3RVA4_9ACTN|nr:DNA-3-methyladenine glycosylase 2 family protein [Actinomadura violacea]MBO2460691.1 DNA-3-methyladenine glycosylase 2 family protein [Actinomadura violacea]